MDDRLSPSDLELDARLRREGARWRTARSECPDPDVLLARTSESLDTDLRDRLERHLASCADCARLAADFETLALDEPDADVEARVRSRVSPPRRERRATWLAAAAAVALASTLGALWWSRPSSVPESAPAVVETAPDPDDAPVMALWAIEAPAVRVPLSSLDVPRSGSAGASGAAAILDALAPYQQGDYAGAIVALENVLRDRPEAGEASFYLGAAYLMADRPAEALSPLARARSLSPASRHAEIDWYLATAEQRSGRPAASRARLAAVCAGSGPFQAQACAAASTIK
jgi:tetratricopeptide (TPR) repeat protein